MRSVNHTIRVLLITCTFSPIWPTFVQAQSISEWGPIRWGAAEDEIESALRGKVARPTSPPDFYNIYVPFIISPHTIGDIEMECFFQFGKSSHHLEQILLRPLTELTKESAPAVFEDLRETLFNRYGPPSSDRTSPGGGRKASWSSTNANTILELGSIINDVAAIVTIAYSPAPNDAQTSQIDLESSTPDFRRSRWGDSRADVEGAEGRKPDIVESDKLGYTDSIDGLEVLSIFVFVDDALVETGYVSTAKHTNKNQYLIDAASLKDLLTTKYGEPIESKTEWLDRTFADSSLDYGLAVSAGHLRITHFWETDRSTVRLELFGDNFETTLRVLYTSKDSVNKLRRLRTRRATDKL